MSTKNGNRARRRQACGPARPVVLAALLLFGHAAGAAGAESGEEGPPPPVAGQEFHAGDSQLAGLLSTLLAENPHLLAARAGRLSRDARAPQAGSLPDPQLSYRYFARTPETRVGPQEHAFELSQSVPWSGKRRLQAEREEHLAESSGWQVRNLERELVAELKRTYFDAAYLQEALTVNAEERALLERFEQIALTRYATGEGIQQHVIKIHTAISRLAAQSSSLHERLAIADRRIARLIGRSEAEIELRPIELALPQRVPDLDRLELNSVQSHPGVRAAQERIEAERSRERRRALESRPDFRLGLGYAIVGKRDDDPGMLLPPADNGKDIVSLMVGINLPVQRKRIRSGIAEAEQSLRAAEHSLRGTRDGLRFEIQDAALRIESTVERGGLYRDVVIPQAEQSLASAEAAYATDSLGFLDLLDAERVLFETRLAHRRLIADYWSATADLELALGRPFPVPAEQSVARAAAAGGGVEP